MHVQGAKFGGKKDKFGGKSFKKLNSAEFMEFVFSKSVSVSVSVSVCTSVSVSVSVGMGGEESNILCLPLRNEIHPVR